MAVSWKVDMQWPKLEEINNGKKLTISTKVSYEIFNKLVYALLHLYNRKEQ